MRSWHGSFLKRQQFRRSHYELWGILPGPHGTWCTTRCCKLRIGSWVDEDAWTVWSLPWAASFFSSGLACTIRIVHRHCKSLRLTAAFFSKTCWRYMSCNDPCAFKMLLPKGLFLTEQTGQKVLNFSRILRWVSLAF